MKMVVIKTDDEGKVLETFTEDVLIFQVDDYSLSYASKEGIKNFNSLINLKVTIIDK